MPLGPAPVSVTGFAVKSRFLAPWLILFACLTAAVTPALAPGDVWARLRSCESGGRYTTNTRNGFFGAYQFHPRTWRNLGFPGLPHQAPPEIQDEAARKLQARSGWAQWPVCSRRIGAR